MDSSTSKNLNDIQSIISLVNDNTFCINKIEDLKSYDKKTPWELKVIGADLAREFSKNNAKRIVRVATVEPINLDALTKDIVSNDLKKCKTTPAYDKDLCFGVEFEKKKYGHGENVVDLAIGQTSISASYLGKLVMVGDPNVGIHGESKIQNFFPTLIEKYKPDIILSSSGISEDSASDDLIKEFGKKNIVHVNSAGNQYPEPTYGLLALNKDVISVGSISELGLKAMPSAEGKDVTILSTSTDSSRFTSQAQPLVAGSLVNVMAMLPGITPKELKFLLQKTAIKTPNTDTVNSDKLNGAGLVNSYKMVRVAKNLQEMWPDNRDEIYEDKVYDFSTEVKSNLLKLKNKRNCDINDFKLLRETFFLNTENLNLLNNLEQVYSKNNFNSESRFIRGLMPYSLNELRKMYKENPSDDIQIRFTQMRSWEDVKSIILNDVSWHNSDRPSPLITPLYDAIKKFKKKDEVVKILNDKLNSDSPEVVSTAIRIGTVLPNINNKYYYKKCFKHKEMLESCLEDYFYNNIDVKSLLQESKMEDRLKYCKILRDLLKYKHIEERFRSQPDLKIKDCIE